jgi:hypothetical protein
MLSQLSLKFKFYLLIAGLLIALLASYQFALKNTINLISENHRQSLQLDSAKEGADQLDVLKTKLNKLKAEIGTQNSSTDFHQEILNTCSKFCSSNGLLIREFPDKETVDIGNSKLEINKISIEGSFLKVLPLVYSCERNKSLGGIISVQFDEQKDLYSQKEHLITSIYFQNMINNQNNN